jgi:hypothetical protein
MNSNVNKFFNIAIKMIFGKNETKMEVLSFDIFNNFQKFQDFLKNRLTSGAISQKFWDFFLKICNLIGQLKRSKTI